MTGGRGGCVDGASGAPCEAEMGSAVGGHRSASGCAVVACDASIGQSCWGPSLADSFVPPGSVFSAMSLKSSPRCHQPDGFVLIVCDRSGDSGCLVRSSLGMGRVSGQSPRWCDSAVVNRELYDRLTVFLASDAASSKEETPSWFRPASESARDLVTLRLCSN